METTDTGGTVPENTPAEPERSGPDVAEGIETAAAGTEHSGVERPPDEAVSGDTGRADACR